tara:strand:- start:484 stop:675 length:192 start_codon:yes stop_codon:yes gene_type:complete
MHGFKDALHLPIKYLLFFLVVTIATISVVESSAMALLSDWSSVFIGRRSDTLSTIEAAFVPLF